MSMFRKVSISRKETLPGDYFLMGVHSPEQAELARPGQFFMLGLNHADHSYDPLLNRPLSVLDISYENGQRPSEVLFLVKAVGRGTRLLAEAAEGDTLRCHGPLGSVFPQPGPNETLTLIGGGVGIAPLFFCASHWRQLVRPVLIYGGRTAVDLPLRDTILALGITHHIFTTEDGSIGEKGLVTESLSSFLHQNRVERAYCCGPNAMMKAVAAIAAQLNLPLWVSLENRMGCGMGICLGCVLPIKEGEGLGMQRVCTEGPVFPAKHVHWEVL